MVDEDSLLKELMSSDFGDTSFNNVRNNFNLMTEKTVNPQKLAALVEKVKRFEASLREGGTVKWFTPESGFDIAQLPKHKAFFDAGAEYPERLALSGNRTGKSIMGCYETTCHLTGDYPDWWAGRRFDHPIDAWAIGPDARTVRDTIQKELMGPVGEWGTGMLPAHTIGKWYALQGTPQAIDVVMVKHKTGGWSRLGFKNYQQDILSFMGTGRHLIWCVTPDTQVMTKRGWTNQPEIGDDVLSYEDGKMKWTRVNAVHRSHYTGEMYRLSSRNNFSIDVTPDHRWLVYNKDTRETYFTITKELKKNEQLIVSGDKVALDGDKYSDSFAALVGWLMTDGSVSKNSNMYITQSVSYNSRKCEVIEKLLAEEFGEVSYTDRPYSKGVGVQRTYAITGEARLRLLEVVDSEKTPSLEFINSLGTSGLESFLGAVIDGDGMRLKSGAWRITSSRQSHVDILQYVAMLLGYRTVTVKNGGAITINAKTTSSSRYNYRRVSVDSLDISKFDYDGEIYCPSTKLGTAVFRTKDGKVLLSGQCDEEVPMEIYNEANIRTATTKGIMICTFTPLMGLTPMVVNFCRKANFLLGAKPILSVAAEDGEHAVGNLANKAVLQIGWDDAPWLDESTKARLLDDTPEHLREARRTGAPAMGSGNVYTTPIEQFTVDPFDIPDSWPRLYALDVGWNRTAGVWAALDPNTDTIYFYDEHYVGQELPSTHAASIRGKGDWIPGVIDPAARGRSQVDGKQLMQQYIELGLELRPARNDVEAGVSLVQQRLASGKLKVFRTCTNWLKEYLIYRRDKNGKVVKEDDHAQDAGRYIVLNIQLAATKTEQTNFGAYNYAVTRYDV